MKNNKNNCVDGQGLTQEDLENKYNELVIEYSEMCIEAYDEDFYECLKERIIDGFQFDNIEEDLKDRLYWSVAVSEGVEDWCYNQWSEDELKYIEDNNIDFDFGWGVYNYIMDNLFDEVVKDRQKEYVNIVGQMCLDSPYLPYYLKNMKEQDGDDFDVYYSVGDDIATYGEMDDDLIMEWVNNNKSLINKKLEKFEGIC